MCHSLGTTIRRGNSLKPYTPDALPLEGLDHRKLLPSVGKANSALASYGGRLYAVPNPGILLSPLINTEAVLSSKIEGTQATVAEVLEHDAGETYAGEKAHDIQEVVNYRFALALAEKEIAERPIQLPLIRQLHAQLMDSVRGQDKEPGEFRKDQNWIGRKGCTIEEATFVPPNPFQLPNHLEAWEKYLGEEEIDPIVQTAIVHAQFELLHPFKDGNGRIGRLLIPLFLYSKGLLVRPSFYLSEYLETNREAYYASLQDISQNGNWDNWILFFLSAVVEQAERNVKRIGKIVDLYDDIKAKVRDVTHSQFSGQAVDQIFKQPIFTTSLFESNSGIPSATAPTIVRRMHDNGIIHVLRPGAGRRPTRYVFTDLLRAAES